MTWIKHFAIKSRARGLQGILEQINPCTTLLLHRLFSPVSLSASWLQTSLDYTQSHQSCFRCWNEPNTHHLLPPRLILASPSFPFAPSAALYICRGKKGKSPFFPFIFSRLLNKAFYPHWASENVPWLPSTLGWTSHIPPEGVLPFSSIYINDKAQVYKVHWQVGELSCFEE